MGFRVLSAATAACLAAGSAAADPVAEHDPARISRFAVGIFCMDEVGSRPSDAPGTIKGTVERLDRLPVLVVETATVPAIERITFGVQAREATENGIVNITVNHPPLGPDGVTSEGWETQMETGEDTVHTYYLGLSDGNPVGRWSVVGMAGEDLLFWAEFDVVPAGTAEDPCVFKPVG